MIFLESSFSISPNYRDLSIALNDVEKNDGWIFRRIEHEARAASMVKIIQAKTLALVTRVTLESIGLILLSSFVTGVSSSRLLSILRSTFRDLRFTLLHHLARETRWKLFEKRNWTEKKTLNFSFRFGILAFFLSFFFTPIIFIDNFVNKDYRLSGSSSSKYRGQV